MRAVRADPGPVILWFAGGAVVCTWLIFHDPAFDYRLVVLGAVVPDLIDGPLGGARVFHSVAAGVGVLAAVMVMTRRRRRLRRRLLAIPIGMFFHLLLDGAWTTRSVFWWPFFGWSFHGARLPMAHRPVLILVAEEAAGAAALLWAWHRFRMSETRRRRRFMRTGYLGRDVA